MNEKIMAALGFAKEVKLIKKKRCPFCKKKIRLSSFRNEISKREYQISGLCQKCQDDFLERIKNGRCSNVFIDRYCCVSSNCV